MAQHKWHKEIKAWADGALIEKRKESSEWLKAVCPRWEIHEDIEYRIKPQPKEPQYLYVYFNERTEKIDFDVIACDLGYLQYLGKIKLEKDDDM